MKLHPVIGAVAQRIRQRSAPARREYLRRIEAAAQRDRGDSRMGCANVAHAFAALPANDKFRVVAEKRPNIAIVTTYNDMLSAHAPFARYPDLIKDEARSLGGTAQVAGGVPAMCDGVIQGTSGMELSLFSRDVIAMATAVALSHDVFDAALLLGICDKIVPVQALVPEAGWAPRERAQPPPARKVANSHGVGREWVSAFRRNVPAAQEGAGTWL